MNDVDGVGEQENDSTPYSLTQNLFTPKRLRTRQIRSIIICWFKPVVVIARIQCNASRLALSLSFR